MVSGSRTADNSSFSLAEFGFTEILANFSLGGKFFVLYKL